MLVWFWLRARDCFDVVSVAAAVVDALFLLAFARLMRLCIEGVVARLMCYCCVVVICECDVDGVFWCFFVVGVVRLVML